MVTVISSTVRMSPSAIITLMEKDVEIHIFLQIWSGLELQKMDQHI